MKLSQSWNFENDTFSNLDSLDNLKYIGELSLSDRCASFYQATSFFSHFHSQSWILNYTCRHIELRPFSNLLTMVTKYETWVKRKKKKNYLEDTGEWAKGDNILVGSTYLAEGGSCMSRFQYLWLLTES